MNQIRKLLPKKRFKKFIGKEEWKKYELGQLGNVAMNRRIFKDQTTNKGEIPFYKIGTFGGEPDAFISRELFEKYKIKYPYPKIGDILISASGSIGRTIEYKGKDEYFQDSNIVWLNHDERLINSFLKQFYEIVNWQGIEGSTIKRLYNKNILLTEISLPTKKEQTQIGEFFKKLDTLIQTQQKKLEKTKTLKSAYLAEMFPADGELKPKLRFKGFNNNWIYEKLGKVTKWSKGTNLAKDVLNKEGKGNSVIHYADLYKFAPVVDGVIHWSEIDEGHIIPQNSLLFPMSDVTPNGLARTTTIIKANVRASSDTLIATISNEISAEYLSYEINAHSKKILPLVTGTTVKHINANSLSTLLIKITEISEQYKIAKLLNLIENYISLEQRKLDKLNNIKQAYLNEMFV